MLPKIELKTERLILRHWKDADFDLFAKMNSDPRVMEYFPGTLSKDESDKFAQRICTHLNEKGWGLWAVSVPGIADFIGFIGLMPVGFTADFTPAVEVGWRLAYDFWDKGYATEGALEAIKFGFNELKLNEIVSFTSIHNNRSRHVMEKLGMYHDEKNDFNHPKLPVDHWLKEHVLYRIRKEGRFTRVFETPPEYFQPLCEVAACYVEVNGKILILERSYTESEGKTWGVPGGKIEPGETPLQGAIRELFEETNIKILPSQFQEIGKLYITKPKGSYIYHMFHVGVREMPLVSLNSEHISYLWIAIDNIDQLPLIGGAKEALLYYERMKRSL